MGTASDSPDVKQDSDSPIICVCAPTGKAADLLGKRCNLPSFTLHSVMYSYYHWRRSTSEAPWKFCEVNALVVDECSLLAVTVFHRVFHLLLTEAKLMKVVLLGDIDQLPSIEPGNFLCDMYRSLDGVGCSVILRTNHRSESQLIVDNAERIAHQRMPVADDTRNFHMIRLSEDDDLSYGRL